jgi:phosphoribosylaminoimidazole (AIR) synthetase
MFRTFNCGIGLDVVGADNQDFADAIEEVSQETGIRCYRLGKCRQYRGKGNKIILKTPYGTFDDY